MKFALSMILLASSLSSFAGPSSRWLTIDNKILKQIKPHLNKKLRLIKQGKDSTVVQVAPQEVEVISAAIHHNLHRCGGFMAHESLQEASKEASNPEAAKGINGIFTDYSIDQQETVSSMVNEVSELEIRTMVQNLSDFGTRHYRSVSGAQSSFMIMEKWKELTAHRSDVKVEMFEHEMWPQGTVILTIEGSELPNEIVIIGGHADSITSMGGIAPGADDNASGIASITEALRVLMRHDHKPKRTLQFMAYAAEEVGLLGSKEIAKGYRAEDKKVVGVMQLDMTLYKGSLDKDIVLISDFTNKHQNEFLGNLINEYVKVPWGYSQCGYACSDHASWIRNGYPASFPFEARMMEINPHIHTKWDTLDSIGGTADHSVNFTKLGIAFLVELGS